MKKMVPIFTYILTAVVFAFAGFAVASLLSSNKYEEEKYTMQAALDAEKHDSLLLEKQVTDLTEENTELDGENSRLRDEIETLNDVIVRMRTAPEAAKLLKERIPYGMTNMIRFMDYRTINDPSSWQYKLQQECSTKDGIRYYDKYICVALGSAYGQDIGDTWHVTLDCGMEFDVILADCKDDGTEESFGDPDENYDGQDCINILEFIVDISKMSKVANDAGTYTVLEQYGGLYGKGGNVAKMEYTGRVWEA